MDVVTTQDNTITQLFSGDFPRRIKKIVLLAGAGALALGTVLGKILLGAASKAAVTGATGNGTLTLDSTTPILAGAKAGVYKVRILRAAIAAIATTPEVPARLAVAVLKDPDGNVLETFDVPAAGGTAVTIENQVKFAMIEGSTLFVAGDGFDITIAAGSGKYAAYDKDNLNGTQVADCILGEAVTVGASDVTSFAYVSGDFNEAALTGYDAKAGVDFEKSTIFIGSVI